MDEPEARADPGQPPVDPTTDRPSHGRRGRRTALAAIAAGVTVVAGLAGLAVWQADRPSAATAPGASPATASPLIAAIDATGALVTVDAAGRRTILSPAEPGVAYGFPAWSPDGARLAVVRSTSADASISILPVARGDQRSSPPPTPVVIYRSAEIPPFYLYWAPDGSRLTFLASEAQGLSLRIAPVDGSAPLDGSGPGSVIRRGAPLYFDWIQADRLLLHVGSGSDAFLGEVGPDGAPVAPSVTSAGDFRPAVVGADRRFMAFVRGQAASAELVVAARDGSGEHAVPVFGPTAVVFDPAGRTVASIAADRAGQADLAFPFGPLRLIDAASGAVRTLLDGFVVGFFWSPDGRTIAALRLQEAKGSTVADGGTVADPRIVAAAAIASADPAAPSATPPPGPELHLLFLDVADGRTRSDRIVKLTAHFVDQFLPYFDQYALSHRVWAPDGRSILLPLVTDAGRDQLVSVPVDGATQPTAFDGQSGFWSP